VKAKDIPSLHLALKDLSHLFPTFYDGFESGIDHAKWYFDQINASQDPWLYAHLIRHWVKRELQRQNINAEDHRPEDLAMSGLQFRHGCWYVRLLKSQRGALPSPQSKRMREFYAQRQLYLSQEFQKIHNLVLLWHMDRLGDFQGLSLVIPLLKENAIGRVEIPHPAQSADQMIIHTQSVLDEDGYDEDALGNLDIFLDEGDEVSLDDEDMDNTEEDA
jgi:hypothetical protein